MSTTTAGQWTNPVFGPEQQRPTTELTPYRVRLGDEVYDQSQFTNDTAHRYHAFLSGVGAGKTVAGIIRMAANAIRWNPNTLGAIITPTSLGFKNAILPRLHEWGFMHHWEYHGPQSEAPGLHLPNGTRIIVESANNERKIQRLRGFDLSWFWMDEAAYIPERAFDVLTGRLRVGEYRNAFITTTPKGKNWVYNRFHPESDDQRQSVNAVLGVPSYANPHLPLDYRRDILDEYGGRFYEQEVLGAFIKPEGLVYPWFDDDTHIVRSVESNIRRYIYGVDWGFRPHPAAILAIGITANDEYVVLEEHYEQQNTDVDLANKATELVQRYGHGRFYCDPSEPANIETFKREGLDAVKADNSITPGIQRVTACQNRLYVMDNCQATINEFGLYSYEDDDEPEDGNDHALDALRYALLTHSGSEISEADVGVYFE